MTQRKADSGQYALYRPQFEHDNCGIGAVVNIKGGKSHETVEKALKIVETWNTGPANTPREKQEMELESYCRYRISSFPEPVIPSAFF